MPPRSGGAKMNGWPENPDGVNMAKVARVNKGECISCGVCIDTVPAVFRFDADNHAEVFDPEGAGEAEIQEAIDLCPVTCIYWDETE